MAHILIVDDSTDICAYLTELFQEAGHATMTAQSLSEALRLADEHLYDAVLLDVYLPDGSGTDYIQEFRGRQGSPEIIVITGTADKIGATHAIRNGCWDYLEKPLKPAALLNMLGRLLEYRASFRQQPVSLPLVERDGIIGQSPVFMACLRQAALAASGEANIHITGETGTGKELIAKLIYRNSSRKNGPFITVDCASLSESLGASMLFGHVRGAFTNADSERQGHIMQAHSGTLFLDEVGELSLDLQKMFLRVLQERRVLPLGSSSERDSDFRLISATNKNIEAMVEQGLFRADLYYRLRGMVVQLPPLRNRYGDIRLVIEELCREHCRIHQMESKVFSEDFWVTAEEYSWPGNLRELKGAIEHVLHLAGQSRMILPQHLPARIRVAHFDSSGKARSDKPVMEGGPPVAVTVQQEPVANSLLLPNDNGDLPSLKQIQEQAASKAVALYLVELMQLTDGDIKEACAIAQLSRSRLYKYLQQHDIRRSGWQAPHNSK